MTDQRMAAVPLGRKDAAPAIEALDSLRQALVDGSIVAFAAVGIERDDTIRSWIGCAQPITRLRMAGAIAHLQHAHLSDEIGD